MERAAVGREVMKQTAAAGDASFVTNPDGTRTYNKARRADGQCYGISEWVAGGSSSVSESFLAHV